MSEYVTEWVDDLPDLKRGEEIVRCRDCKYVSRDEKIYRECYRLHGYNSFTVEEYGFCAWGVKRKDGGE